MNAVKPAMLPLQEPPRDYFAGHLMSMNRDPLSFTLNNLRYGDLVKLNFMGATAYQVNKLEWIAEILLNSRLWEKSRFYKGTLRDYVGDGLLISEGDFWKRQRKLIQPAFHTKRITSYGETMVADTMEMLSSYADNQTRDIASDLMTLTFGITGKTLFGTNLGDTAARIESAVNFMLEDIVNSYQSLLPLPSWLPTPTHQKRKKAIEQLNQAILPMIQSRREKGTDNGDLLSMLLMARDEDGNAMTDLELRNEVLTLMLAGQETTATALTWLIYLLSRHPQVLAKLEAEIEASLGKRLPTFEDLKAMPYLETVVKETLRLYPPVWILSRQNNEATELGGYEIPKQTSVMISIWALHRDPRFYEEAESFIPERWTDAMRESLPRYAYLPFAAGPRVCIGNSFALMEIPLVLITLIQQFRFHLPSEHPVELAPLATLRPKNGMSMRLEKR